MKISDFIDMFLDPKTNGEFLLAMFVVFLASSGMCLLTIYLWGQKVSLCIAVVGMLIVYLVNFFRS